jgi:hypothetical protein
MGSRAILALEHGFVARQHYSVCSVINILLIKMKASLTLQDLALVFAIQRQDPTLITPESLSKNGIVPVEWGIAQQPVRTPQAALVRYQNGISIAAHPNKVVFVQSLADDRAIEIPGVAQRYAQVLQNLSYQGVGSYIRAYIPFASEEKNAAQEYLTSHFLAKGSWQSFGTAPVEASLNLKYTLEHSQLNLSIQEAALQHPKQQRFPVILFVGSFSHSLSGQSATEKLQKLTDVVAHWQSDVEIFKSLVSEKFLGAEAPPVLPSLFATAQSA